MSSEDNRKYGRRGHDMDHVPREPPAATLPNGMVGVGAVLVFDARAVWCGMTQVPRSPRFPPPGRPKPDRPEAMAHRVSGHTVRTKRRLHNAVTASSGSRRCPSVTVLVQFCDDSATALLNQFHRCHWQQFGDVCRHNLCLNEMA